MHGEEAVWPQQSLLRESWPRNLKSQHRRLYMHTSHQNTFLKMCIIQNENSDDYYRIFCQILPYITCLSLYFCKRVITLHAGNEEGFILGLERYLRPTARWEAIMGTILKWLNKVINNLPLRSVLDNDNASYHDVLVDRPPVGANEKITKQKWLTRHMVPWNTKVFKGELHALTKKHKPEPDYFFHQILESQTHLSLILLPYHVDLNQFESIWGNLKGAYSGLYTKK